MAIRKGTFAFTFLFDDETDPVDQVMDMSVSDIINECDDGTMIGHLSSNVLYEIVSPLDVSEQLRSMGNDGTFFNDEE
jgi:hypothetical protein